MCASVRTISGDRIEERTEQNRADRTEAREQDGPLGLYLWQWRHKHERSDPECANVQSYQKQIRFRTRCEPRADEWAHSCVGARGSD